MIGAERAVAAFTRIERAAGPSSFTELMELELTMAQCRALFLLDSRGPLTVGGFARLVGTKLPAASVFVDRLEQAGLVSRRPSHRDRRRVVVELTERAAPMVARLRGNRERVIAAIERLCDDDAHALARGMEALADELERPAP